MIRAFTMENAILLYFTISKSYFINYIIPFYNIPSIPNYLNIVFLTFFIIFVGLRAQITYWALGLSQELSSPRTSEW